MVINNRAIAMEMDAFEYSELKRCLKAHVEECLFKALHAKNSGRVQSGVGKMYEMNLEKAIKCYENVSLETFDLSGEAEAIKSRFRWEKDLY